MDRITPQQIEVLAAFCRSPGRPILFPNHSIELGCLVDRGLIRQTDEPRTFGATDRGLQFLRALGYPVA